MNMILNSVAEPDPVLFGRSRCEGPAPVPVSGWTLDKTEEILKNILSVGSNIDQMLIKKLILRNKWIFFSRENGNMLNKKIMVESLIFRSRSQSRSRAKKLPGPGAG